MILKKMVLWMVLVVVPGTFLEAQDITFKASAPLAVVLGTQFRLTYTVMNTHNCTELRAPSSINEYFDNLAGPSPTQGREFQMINGKSTNIIYTTFTYILVGKKEGTFTLEPATIKADNATYKSNLLTIKVLPPDQASTQQQSGGGQASQSSEVGNDAVFMRMIVSNRNVYEQEGFLVTFKLYVIPQLDDFINLKFPEFEGFLSQDIEQKDPQWTVENYNGRNYRTGIIRQSILYPQRSGKLTIGSAKGQAILRIKNQSGRRGFFEDFLDTYQNVSKEVVSPPVTIDVKPLPPDKPVSFSGAVGDFSMASSINKTTLNTNEAITIKLTFKGNGNIKLLKHPEMKFPNDFEIYTPTFTNDFRVSVAGAGGTKTIEYIAIPYFAGDFTIPAVTFSYFDTKSGTYKTLTSEEYNLHVEKSEGSVDVPVVSNYTNRESVRFLGKDIRYIKVNKPHFVENKDIFFASFLYVMAYVMIAILFIVFFIIYRKQVRENANIAFMRTKKANKMAIKRLKQAEKLLKENREEPFYEEVLRALWGYLSDKLNIPQSGLMKENVSAELSKYGVNDNLTNEFLNIINTCEFARYAPNHSSGAMDKLFGETADVIEKMENTIKK